MYLHPFIPFICHPWNSLPFYILSLSYNLDSFRRKVSASPGNQSELLVLNHLTFNIFFYESAYDFVLFCFTPPPLCLPTLLEKVKIENRVP